ncbi:MAG: ribonuclease III [Oscillospiraceae bacterium]|nr:ribonuclease III [Oscillospiraceae bacterium]
MTKLEQALGYVYQDKTLLRTALSHTSYANEVHKDALRSYERLEFLGDAILGFATAEYLYHTFPTKQEGELTKIRAELVCEKNLAEIAHQIHLGDYLLLGNGEEQGGGRNRASILCDVIEALIAAAFIDGGTVAAQGIVTRLVIPNLTKVLNTHDFKTELQEIVQRKRDQALTYELIGEQGPDHCKQFSVRVLLNGAEVGRGVGTSKKRAEQAAAEQAIQKLSKSG